MADIPDGADKRVAVMAIAWEMTKTAFEGKKLSADPDAGADDLLKVYEKSFRKVNELASERSNPIRRG